MIFGQTIESLKKTDLKDKTYLNCRFIDCEFIGVSFEGSVFENCSFEKCNLTMLKNKGVIFKKIEFLSSKIAGINFQRFAQDEISFNFKKCFIKQCSFESMKMSKTKFLECVFEGVDFEFCDLRETNFRKSLFEDSFFNNCNLEKTNFLGAKGFNINPSLNKMKNAKFNKDSLYGLVKEFGIHLGGK